MARTPSNPSPKDYRPFPNTAEESNHQLEQRIRERAYQIYVAREGEAGSPILDWHEAERQLEAQR
jgi:hypothetical protein